ncbi:GGDEF domain-containing protein [Bacillus dakarensis]|uniref:GGDEF domain-containing protein n=1 Tax=Robertmurraya dakarensis TaxID=1926278 RepID=UPI00301DFBEA
MMKILSSKKYTILYLDLDSFKSFNDTYGFREGDALIKETAQIISDVIMTNDNDPSFVGHIGGDDFIAVLPHHRYEELCNSIINRFEQAKLRFYSEVDLQNGYVKSTNRVGVLENVPLVSISIAVITNKRFSYETVEELSKAAAMVKQKCKAITKSVCICIEDPSEIR